MSLISDLQPLNLAVEKEKFFSRSKYNPIFQYRSSTSTAKMAQYGQPKPKFVNLAQEILAISFHHYSWQDLDNLEGGKVSLSQAKKILATFLKDNHLEKIIKVLWGQDQLGRIAFRQDCLKIRQDFNFPVTKFKATLAHELGTHALRRINYGAQPYFRHKKKFGFKEYLPTEEGLATFHSLLERNYQLSYSYALIYLLINLASQASFAEVYQLANRYYQDPEKSWLTTVKIKRGLTDTSQPGAFTKGIVYLEGLAKVWKYFQQRHFDLPTLYFGKIDVDDVDKAKNLNPNFKPLLPSFYRSNPDAYQQKISKIAHLNLLDQLS